MHDYRVFATAKPYLYYTFVVTILIFVTYVFAQDLTGSGLRGSSYFRFFGYFIYPIFYISATVGLFTIGRIILNLDSAIAVNKERSLLKVFATEIPFSDVASIGIERFPFKIGRALVVRRVNGPPLRLGSLLLREDMSHVVEALNSELRLTN